MNSTMEKRIMIKMLTVMPIRLHPRTERMSCLDVGSRVFLVSHRKEEEIKVERVKSRSKRKKKGVS